MRGIELTNCLSFGRCVVIASGGCIGSYSALAAPCQMLHITAFQVSYVASFPAYLRMILAPPELDVRSDVHRDEITNPDGL